MKDTKMLNLEETLTNEFLEAALSCYYNFKERLFGLVEAYSSIRASIDNISDAKYRSSELDMLMNNIIVLVADAVVEKLSYRLGQGSNAEYANNKNFQKVNFNLINEFYPETLKVKYEGE